MFPFVLSASQIFSAAYEEEESKYDESQTSEHGRWYKKNIINYIFLSHDSLELTELELSRYRSSQHGYCHHKAFIKLYYYNISRKLEKIYNYI